MARDCPDRQRGSDWRNGGGYGGGQRNPRALGTGDAVDREMEVSLCPERDLYFTRKGPA